MNEKEYIKMIASAFMGLYANQVFIIGILHELNQHNCGKPIDLTDVLKSSFRQIDNFKEVINQVNQPDVWQPGG